MKYLCVETSGKGGFFAGFTNGQRETAVVFDEGFHSENLSVRLPGLLPYLSKIQFIAVSAGPGRFTGLRAGVNFSKTLAYHLKCPVYLCCSLRLAAEPYLDQGPVLCVREAFGNMFYAGGWQKRKDTIETLISPRAFFFNDLEEETRKFRIKIKKDFIRVVDEVSGKIPFLFKNQLARAECFLISPESFSSMILRGGIQSQFKPWFEVEPCYLRSPGILKKSFTRAD